MAVTTAKLVDVSKPMRFCPACNRTLDHDDDHPYCYREACVARRTGLWEESRDPSARPAFVRVTGQPKRKRIKYAKPKHARRSARVEPKHEPVEPSAEKLPYGGRLLASKLDTPTLQKLADLMEELR
jgi:hypothetical protein